MHRLSALLLVAGVVALPAHAEIRTQAPVTLDLASSSGKVNPPPAECGNLLPLLKEWEKTVTSVEAYGKIGTTANVGCDLFTGLVKVEAKVTPLMEACPVDKKMKADWRIVAAKDLELQRKLCKISKERLHNWVDEPERDLPE